MDYHNCNNTPLDRIDEALIKELHDLEYNKSSPYTGNHKSEFQYLRNTNQNNTRNIRCGNCSKNKNNYYKKQESMCNCSDALLNNCDNQSFINPKLSDVPLAMLYSPYQEFEDINELNDAFDKGTLFKRLDFPFYMSSCKGIDNSFFEHGREKCTGGL